VLCTHLQHAANICIRPNRPNWKAPQNHWLSGLLSIVRNSKYKRTQRFGSWICFHPQVRGGRQLLLLCWSLRKSLPQSLDNPWNITATVQTPFLTLHIFLLHLMGSSRCRVFSQLLLCDMGYPATKVSSFQGTQQSRCLLLLTCGRKQIQFPKCCFLVFRIPDDGQSPDIQWF
jgi:hypothetical protein